MAVKNCVHHKRIFSTEFETCIIDSDASLEKINCLNVDTVILCFCSANKIDLETITSDKKLAGPMPVLTCSRNLNADFVNAAGRLGINAFLECEMDVLKSHYIIYDTIHQKYLREFFKISLQNGIFIHHKLQTIINEVIYAFPHRLTAGEIAGRVGITRHWLNHLFQKAFGATFKRTIRRLWIYQILH
jgi:AraC-like DNA-binding protein